MDATPLLIRPCEVCAVRDVPGEGLRQAQPERISDVTHSPMKTRSLQKCVFIGEMRFACVTSADIYISTGRINRLAPFARGFVKGLDRLSLNGFLKFNGVRCPQGAPRRLGVLTCTSARLWTLTGRTKRTANRRSAAQIHAKSAASAYSISASRIKKIAAQSQNYFRTTRAYQGNCSPLYA